LPEFNPNSIVRHHFAIDDSDGGGIGYDMIIGQDLCWHMGIVVDYDEAMVEWNGMAIPMKDEDFPCHKGLKSKRGMRQIIVRSAEPKVTQEATSRILKILDSDYKKGRSGRGSRQGYSTFSITTTEVVEAFKKI
jgi:hypothetical protein